MGSKFYKTSLTKEKKKMLPMNIATVQSKSRPKKKKITILTVENSIVVIRIVYTTNLLLKNM